MEDGVKSRKESFTSEEDEKHKRKTGNGEVGVGKEEELKEEGSQPSSSLKKLSLPLKCS